jgi:hypothetical protein
MVAVLLPPARFNLLGSQAAPPEDLVDDPRRIRPPEVGGRPQPVDGRCHEQLLLDFGDFARIAHPHVLRTELVI